MHVKYPVLASFGLYLFSIIEIFVFIFILPFSYGTLIEPTVYDFEIFGLSGYDRNQDGLYEGVNISIANVGVTSFSISKVSIKSNDFFYDSEYDPLLPNIFEIEPGKLEKITIYNLSSQQLSNQSDFLLSMRVAFSSDQIDDFNISVINFEVSELRREPYVRQMIDDNLILFMIVFYLGISNLPIIGYQLRKNIEYTKKHLINDTILAVAIHIIFLSLILFSIIQNTKYQILSFNIFI